MIGNDNIRNMVSWCLAIGYPESGFMIKQCVVSIQQEIHPYHSYQTEDPFYTHMNQSYKWFEADVDVDERFDTRIPTRPEHHQLQTTVTLVSESHGLSKEYNIVKGTVVPRVDC